MLSSERLESDRREIRVDRNGKLARKITTIKGNTHVIVPFIGGGRRGVVTRENSKFRRRKKSQTQPPPIYGSRNLVWTFGLGMEEAKCQVLRSCQTEPVARIWRLHLQVQQSKRPLLHCTLCTAESLLHIVPAFCLSCKEPPAHSSCTAKLSAEH